MNKVTYVKLHQNIFIPGLGDLGLTLPTPGKTRSLEMTDTGNAVEVKATNNQGKTYFVKVPYGNIAALLIDSESQ